MTTTLSLHKFKIWSVTIVLLLCGAVVTAALLVASPDAADHALSHLAIGAPVALGAMLVLWRWPVRQRDIGGVGRVLLVVGLLVFSLGQLGESIGAFGWRYEMVRYSALTTLHDIAIFGIIGLPIVALAIPWALLGIVHRWMPWGRRMNKKALTVLGAVLSILSILGLVYLLIGGP